LPTRTQSFPKKIIVAAPIITALVFVGIAIALLGKPLDFKLPRFSKAVDELLVSLGRSRPKPTVVEQPQPPNTVSPSLSAEEPKPSNVVAPGLNLEEPILPNLPPNAAAPSSNAKAQPPNVEAPSTNARDALEKATGGRGQFGPLECFNGLGRGCDEKVACSKGIGNCPAAKK
jgi:hypothetical protein